MNHESEEKIEDKLFSITHSITKVKNVSIYTWVFNDKDNKLCILTNKKNKFTIKDKVINTNKYYIEYVNRRNKNCNNISILDVQDYIELIEKSSILFNKSNDIIKYINNEIGIYNICNCVEAIWSLKISKTSNYLKIVIDKYNFTINVFNGTNESNIVTSENLVKFINFNKLKILNVIKHNNKLKRVLMFKSKMEHHIKINIGRDNNIIPELAYHDATRKVGSRVNSSSIYIDRPLKEMYETQACKIFPSDLLS